MRKATILLTVMAAMWAGCKPPPEVKEAKIPEKIPLTKAEVLAELRPTIEPLREVLHPTATGARHPGISNANREIMMAAVRDAQLKYGSEPFAKEAFQELGAEVIEIAKASSQESRWRLTAACIDVHEMLQLESARMRQLDKRAQQNLSSPKITVKGFVVDEDRDETYVYLDLADRQTGEVRTMMVREGEEKFGLRILEIIGANSAVRVEYVPVPGLIFEVEGPER